MKYNRPKRKKLKMYQAKLEELVDQYELKKTCKPDLEPLFQDVEKCLGETNKQAREIGKVAAAVANHKASIQNQTVVLAGTYTMILLLFLLEAISGESGPRA